MKLYIQTPMNDFTSILNATVEGDNRSKDEVLPQVYEELRKLAYVHMASELSGHTLQPTALVHEVWLQMVRVEDRSWKNRACFFSYASTAMRHILVDHARKKSNRKHGGNRQKLNMDDLEVAEAGPDDRILMVEDALEQMERVRPEWARIVVMKYFGGMTNDEVAQVLEISESTVRRYWKSAKIWLYRQIASPSDDAG
ncbi:MAG: sigma-70 family RNA polymerase sigma factor [Pontiellaceae bacterium]|nr:sigma-70 family RNA polymerase sigma factor [Pontiellaceae bacterium]MBN2786064.1 sigma-70 family RNA polymerase sigma factor [Pontiellaceae bacterium]